MKRRHLLILIIMVLGVNACNNTKNPKNANSKTRQAQAPIAEVKNPQSAILILKPERKNIRLNRDPFEPLFYSQTGSYDSRNIMDTHAVKDLEFLGIARINDKFVAFLKNNSQRGTYRVNDRVNDYTIKRIENNKVILSNGSQIITLKRGVQSETR